MYLITGGCGFIGSHIAEALVAMGASVRILDNLSTGHLSNIAPLRSRVELVQGDIRDPEVVGHAMRDVRFVFHEAALVSVAASVEDPRLNHDINITGTLNVLLAARDAGVQRVVAASSAAVYGDTPDLPKREELVAQPTSPYGLAKLAMEHYLHLFSTLYGVETVALRYFNVYGPRQDPSSMYSGVISRFTHLLREGRTPTVFGDGHQTRDFVYVADVVAANLAAAASPSLGRGEAINVATGRATSLLDLLDQLRALTGATFTTRFAPARPGDIRHSVADVTAAAEHLGLAPAYDLSAGLALLLKAEGFSLPS